MTHATTAVEYGDPDLLRRRVDELREQAVDVRAVADRLVAQTERIGWTGRAAASMRQRVAERAAHLRSAAGDHEVAADALEVHLQAVERATDTISEVERRATVLVADARTRLAAVEAGGQASTAQPDPDDEALAAFVAPPSGHRDWLEVDLPGLSERTP